MATEPLFNDNRDIINGTLERFMVKEPPLSYAYRTYEAFNMLYAPGVMKVSGKELRGFVVTGTVGNAKFASEWAQDTLVAKNITKQYNVPTYKHCSGGMVFNDIESSANVDPERIFDVVSLQWKKARAEVIDKIHLATWSGLASVNDDTSPYSVFNWLTLGTQGSSGGFTGYQGRYNDGSTPGAAFDVGGLNSSATVVPEFASYYADHAGLIDETLLRVINDALMTLNFKPPVMLPGKTVPETGYATFTSKNVMLTLNQLYAKLNSHVGPQPMNQYYPLSPIKVPGAIPLVWVDILDTANASVYGTDPIVGINMTELFPTYLKGWDFKIVKAKDFERHLVSQWYLDYAGQMFSIDRARSGFLVSNHPSN